VPPGPPCRGKRSPRGSGAGNVKTRCGECKDARIPLRQARSYQRDRTRSRSLSEVKLVRARRVLRWVTTLEHRVLCLFDAPGGPPGHHYFFFGLGLSAGTTVGQARCATRLSALLPRNKRRFHMLRPSLCLSCFSPSLEVLHTSWGLRGAWLERTGSWRGGWLPCVWNPSYRRIPRIDPLFEGGEREGPRVRDRTLEYLLSNFRG
jgi:hypothetical protein